MRILCWSGILSGSWFLDTRCLIVAHPAEPASCIVDRVWEQAVTAKAELPLSLCALWICNAPMRCYCELHVQGDNLMLIMMQSGNWRGSHSGCCSIISKMSRCCSEGLQLHTDTEALVEQARSPLLFSLLDMSLQFVTMTFVCYTDILSTFLHAQVWHPSPCTWSTIISLVSAVMCIYLLCVDSIRSRGSNHRPESGNGYHKSQPQ